MISIDASYWVPVVTFLGGLGGGWAIARHFYKKTQDDTHTQFVALARIAEERGWAEWVRDEHGNITTGRIFRSTISDSLNASDSIAATGATLPWISASGSGKVIDRDDP